jgi:hypothetical protein
MELQPSKDSSARRAEDEGGARPGSLVLQRLGRGARPWAHHVLAPTCRARPSKLAIQKLCQGSCFPTWRPERRRRAEQARISVVATAYLLGVHRSGRWGVSVTGLLMQTTNLAGAAFRRPGNRPGTSVVKAAPRLPKEHTMTTRAAKRARVRAGLLLAPALAAVGCGTVQRPLMSAQDATAVAAAKRAVHTGQCPAQAPPGEVRAGDGGGKGLVPFVPDRLLLCGYAPAHRPGSKQPPPPVRAMVTDPAVIARLRTTLNGLGPFPSGRLNCPNASGGTVLEFFMGGDRIIELEESMTGCQEVVSGGHERWVGTSDLGTTVMGLLPADYCPSVWMDDCGFVHRKTAR